MSSSFLRAWLEFLAYGRRMFAWVASLSTPQVLVHKKFEFWSLQASSEII